MTEPATKCAWPGCLEDAEWWFSGYNSGVDAGESWCDYHIGYKDGLRRQREQPTEPEPAPPTYKRGDTVMEVSQLLNKAESKQVASRSVQRRVAAQKGEPAPQFDEPAVEGLDLAALEYAVDEAVKTEAELATYFETHMWIPSHHYLEQRMRSFENTFRPKVAQRLIEALRQADPQAAYERGWNDAMDKHDEVLRQAQQQAQEWEDTANATAEIVHKLEQQVADLERDNQELHESSLGFQELAIKHGKLKTDYERLEQQLEQATGMIVHLTVALRHVLDDTNDGHTAHSTTPKSVEWAKVVLSEADVLLKVAG